jgi:proteic killer suppression protein
VIANFRDRETEKVWNGEFSRRLPTNIQELALTKLRILNAAIRLENLLVPPGNRLEALKGDRKGQHSIRINRQWRVCFQWSGGNAYDVEIVDYH